MQKQYQNKTLVFNKETRGVGGEVKVHSRADAKYSNTYMMLFLLC